MTIDRKTQTPFLVRVKHPQSKEGALLYTWLDATLREVVSLLAKSIPELKEPQAEADLRSAAGTVLGRVFNWKESEADSKTLADLNFVPGDQLDLSIANSPKGPSAGPIRQKPTRSSFDSFGSGSRRAPYDRFNDRQRIPNDMRAGRGEFGDGRPPRPYDRRISGDNNGGRRRDWNDHPNNGREDRRSSGDRDYRHADSRSAQRPDDSYRRSDSRGAQRADDRDYRQADSRGAQRPDDRDYRQSDSRGARRADDRDYRQADSRGAQRPDDRDYRKADSRDAQRSEDRGNRNASFSRGQRSDDYHTANSSRDYRRNQDTNRGYADDRDGRGDSKDYSRRMSDDKGFSSGHSKDSSRPTIDEKERNREEKEISRKDSTNDMSAFEARERRRAEAMDDSRGDSKDTSRGDSKDTSRGDSKETPTGTSDEKEQNRVASDSKEASDPKEPKQENIQGTSAKDFYYKS